MKPLDRPNPETSITKQVIKEKKEKNSLIELSSNTKEKNSSLNSLIIAHLIILILILILWYIVIAF